ncbi:hypothetical protein DSM104443_01818 [Usitatibacter rugosus]|uniref:LTXXQ motif family protein n=1 Tax=Usitatibacter rugosus TaxID=2732067 RepID=A0A6M4GTT2_9PROT|nr:hypothetical protein [Usitatibacter rugosus]QJR10749.1 hypothetical protein DSM104443_01818 [Usitatibacter rugosus]
MRKLPLVVLLAALAVPPALADWDEAREKRDAAERKAQAAESARKKAEMDRIRSDTELKAARAYLGPAAEGKSDAEARRLYAEKMAVIQRAGKGDAAAKAQLQGLNPEQQAQMDAAMKGMTGKSLTEFNSMSDAEMKAYQRDMEKKYGK